MGVRARVSACAMRSPCKRSPFQFPQPLPLPPCMAEEKLEITTLPGAYFIGLRAKKIKKTENGVTRESKTSFIYFWSFG